MRDPALASAYAVVASQVEAEAGNAGSGPIIHLPWPFPDPPDTGSYVSRGLMDGSTVIESVLHDHEGDWQVLDGTDPVERNLMLVCLEDVVRRHPVVGALCKLPVGWRADMNSDVQEWEVSP